MTNTHTSVAILICIFIISCSKDEDKKTPTCESGNELTYTQDLKSLIDTNCATSGCHNAGSNRGDYTSYAGLLPDINSGKIENRVLSKQDMPRNSELSQAELNDFQCWADNGFAE